MGKKLSAGPYKMVQTSHNGDAAPWYIIPFDKDGVCTAPLTRADLIESATKKTDVFLFSHGWNNDWDTASERYESFIGGFIKMRSDFGLTLPGEYRPLLAGVFWPSTALVMPWERAPKFAGAPAASQDETEAWRRELEDVAVDLDEADRKAFYALVQENRLAPSDAKKLAEILAKAVARFDAADEEVGGPTESPPTADELLNRVKAMPKVPGNDTAPGTFGFAT